MTCTLQDFAAGNNCSNGAKQKGLKSDELCLHFNCPFYLKNVCSILDYEVSIIAH